MHTYWYIKFYWPAVDNWQIDIEKAGKVLISIWKVFQKFVKIETKNWSLPSINKCEKISLQTYEITNNCTSIQITTEIIWSVLNSTPAEVLTYAQVGKIAWDNLWLKEFCNKFMWTLWEQLALKLFAKSKDLKVINPKIDHENWAQVVVWNELGEKKSFSYLARQLYLASQNDLNHIFALEQWKEEKMIVWFQKNDQSKDTWSITYKDKTCFNDYPDFNINDRLQEEFEEDISFQQTIIWRFVDYYWLAHKYHFSFQARKQQDTVWKQKIVCMVDPNKISEILDLLKPENSLNITITGKATKDFEWKIDKIKIETIFKWDESLFEI